MKLTLILKVVLGFMALLLGAIGIFLPVWPTTPFVILAIGCFSSTPKIQAKILKISFFREYYESYTKGQGLKKSTVAGSLLFLWIMLIISAIAVDKLFVSLILLVVCISVTVHILWMSRDKENRKIVWRKSYNEK